MTIILQPCIEAHFVETSTLLKLKLSNNDKSDQPETKNVSENNDIGDWSFLKVFSNIDSSCPKEKLEKENVYVHPLSKKAASSRLSEKSLQLCTENLGSETGSDILDSSSFIQSHEWDCITSHLTVGLGESPNPTVIQTAKQYHGLNDGSTTTTSCVARMKNSCRKFPPPLTTISGANSVQVKPHREGGRLVIKAVKTPTKPTCFQAERSHGRLRLCYLNENSDNLDSQVCPDENEVKTEKENECNDEHVLEKSEDLCYQQDDDDQEICNQMNKDMEGNNYEMEVEIGKEKFQRIGRCIEKPVYIPRYKVLLHAEKFHTILWLGILAVVPWCAKWKRPYAEYLDGSMKALIQTIFCNDLGNVLHHLKD